MEILKKDLILILEDFDFNKNADTDDCIDKIIFATDAYIERSYEKKIIEYLETRLKVLRD